MTHEELEDHVRELLAVIFRDGGQYTNSIGLEQALKVAADEFYRLRESNRQLTRELE